MKKITYLLVMLAAGSAAAQEDCNLQYDGNGDGAVNVEDVLGVLSEFSEVCDNPPVENGPCGDSLSITYWGHDYALTEIGEQCWFAENLRTFKFSNGDNIPNQIANSPWMNNGVPMCAVYNESDEDDFYYYLDLYGVLYNWHCVDDSRNLCPSGFHASTILEWDELLEFLTANGQMSVGGMHLKSSVFDEVVWNGSNFYGFTALPGGRRRDTNGWFGNEGTDAYFWTTSQIGGSGAKAWRINGGQTVLHEESYVQSTGMSVRCLKD